MVSSWSWTLWLYVPTTFLLLLFPDGRLPSPRWRPVAWCAAIGVIGFVAGFALDPGPLEDFPRITNPYGVDSPILGAVTVAGAILATASMVASAVSLIVRMRRAGRVERQQIKWLAYGGAVVVGAVFVGGMISVWIGEVGISLIVIGLLGVPIFTGVAILRYRLYDIDIVINRTLVYGSLTVMLVAVYFGGVAALQASSAPSPGSSNPTRSRGLHPGHSGAVQPAASSHPVVRGPTLLPEQVRRRQNARRLQLQVARGDRPRLLRRRGARGGKGDHAARPRLLVATLAWGGHGGHARLTE